MKSPSPEKVTLKPCSRMIASGPWNSRLRAFLMLSPLSGTTVPSSLSGKLAYSGPRSPSQRAPHPLPRFQKHNQAFRSVGTGSSEGREIVSSPAFGRMRAGGFRKGPVRQCWFLEATKAMALWKIRADSNQLLSLSPPAFGHFAGVKLPQQDTCQAK